MLGVQSLSVLCLASWSFISSIILLWLIDKILPIRMKEDEELLGADLVEHRIRHVQVCFYETNNEHIIFKVINILYYMCIFLDWSEQSNVCF